MGKILSIFIVQLVFFSSCQMVNNLNALAKNNSEMLYKMPEESDLHEGTWLQWPHEYQYGVTYRNRLDPTWIEMTRELITSETVHIIVYDQDEKDRVTHLLEANNIDLKNIDFNIYPTDDVWARDNGPIYVKDNKKKLFIEDWGFNGWGNKAEYDKCNKIPEQISKKQNIKLISLDDIMINEGGSVEIDGKGTLMACKSSILNRNRNPDLTQKKAENIFSKYLGVKNFIWLDGVPGLEITDMHIDGFARFGGNNTIVTMNKDDLRQWDVLESDINKIFSSKDSENKPYKFLELPLTKNNVVTTYGKKLGYKGSYVNYYIANNKVLVPNYEDPNDKIANNIIQSLYPTRKVVGIDTRNLYANGGMIHCVTQQQPK